MSWTKNHLHTVRVVDLTQVVSGSVASMMLADYGAEVIKVEPLEGEPYRRYGTPVPGASGSENLNAMRFNRNKKSLALDLKTEAGRDVLADLIRESDVVIENFRPGVFARLGFDFARLKELNPAVVYTTVSGYGHEDLLPSPNSHDSAYAILAEANAGLLHLAGEPDGRPVWMGFAMSDIFSGVLAFSATLLALQEVGSGRGSQRVDISMFDAAMFMNDLTVNAYTVLGRITGRGQYPLQAPWGAFPTADGYLAIAVMSEREWKQLCEAVGRPDMAKDERYATGERRAEAMPEIDEVITNWLAKLSTGEAAAALRAAGVPSAPVNDASDVAKHPHVKARQMLVGVHHPDVGIKHIVGNPIKSTVPDRLSEGSALPLIGEHSEAVLLKVLGYNEAIIRELLNNGIIRSP